MDVRLQTEPFDPGALLSAFCQGRRETGAAVTDIKDVMNRMGRILEHHDISIDDHKDRIDRLERGE